MDSVERVVEQIARECLARDMTVALVESLTSGAIATSLGRGGDAAQWFRGAVVAYGTITKETVLGLEPGTDPCSPSCAEQLAENGRHLLLADVCVSVTGVGGPEPAGGHAAGEVHIGTATTRGVTTETHRFDGSPEDVVRQSTHAVLASMRDALTGS